MFTPDDYAAEGDDALAERLVDEVLREVEDEES